MPLLKLVVSEACLLLLSLVDSPSAFRSPALPELPASELCGGLGEFGFSGRKSMALGDEVLELDLRREEEGLLLLEAG